MLLNVAVVGCGNISDIYITNCVNKFGNISIVALCDIDDKKAIEKAKIYNIKEIKTFDEILIDENIDIILNLTPPKNHYEIIKRSLLAGKHVYTEKVMATTYNEAIELVELSEEKQLYFCSAPDTFLGASIQTAIKLIEDNIIGNLIGGTARMTCPGYEYEKDECEFYYQKGAGPLFDMGPYYLMALANILGSAIYVSGMSSQSKKYINGKMSKIHVEIPTYVTGQIFYKNNVIFQLLMSFDVWESSVPFIEIYGEKGTITLPDPNYFTGDIKVKIEKEPSYFIKPYGYQDNMRGLGLYDMVQAIIHKKKYCECSAKRALHIYEIMHGINYSSENSSYYYLNTLYE